MASVVPAHECRWYPISYDVDGAPALYACSGTRKCIKTMTQAQYERKRNKPQIVEVPYDD